jgi:NAD(P)-dependent dehydrogenase (short-subunit alcohol dehydrogenase family)
MAALTDTARVAEDAPVARSFDGRQVVVTGGSGALGQAVVARLVADGATVHVPCADAAEAAKLGGRAGPSLHVTVTGSLADEGAVAAFYGALPALWASIQVAGGFAMSRIEDTSRAQFDALLAMNATTCFLSAREAVQAIRRTGAGGGRIVTVAAMPGIDPRRGAGMIAYAASKAAVAAITQALAEEVRREGIRVTAVVPGVLDTPANRAAMPDADRSLWSPVDDVAATIVFLASPAAAVVHGALIPV